MTDKQIIIDGCDVSGCVKLRPYNECGCQPNYGGSYGLCSEWKNCYYKRMMHTGAELNIHKNDKEHAYKRIAELQEQLKRKEEECERLKEEMFAHFHKTGEVPALLGFTIDDIANLVKENNTLKQYKKSKQASYEELQKKCNELELENRKLKVNNKELKFCYKNNLQRLREEETNLTKLVNKYLRLEQTLDEIKELAKSGEYIGFWDEQISRILQKCNEVLDESN